MIARMATPAPKTAAGSVGTVETQFLDLPKPLRLDCGRDAASDPHRLRDLRHAVAGPRQRHPRLPRAERRRARRRHSRNAAAGRARAMDSRADDRDGTTGQGPRLVGRHDRPRQGVRHRPLLRRLHQPARRMPRHDRAVIDEPGDRQAVRVGFSGHYRRRHGADRARIPRRARIERLAAVAGGSLGGMQAFEWAILYPDQVDAIVAIASTHALQPQGVAWNAIARNAIMADPAWQGGHYYGTGRKPDAGMGVARMVGHITYLSAKSLGDKFGRRLQFADDIRYTLTDPEFEVESYLRHQADSFVRRFDANTYLYTSRALTYFDLARQYGNGRLTTRCATCRRERC